MVFRNAVLGGLVLLSYPMARAPVVSSIYFERTKWPSRPCMWILPCPVQRYALGRALTHYPVEETPCYASPNQTNETMHKEVHPRLRHVLSSSTSTSLSPLSSQATSLLILPPTRSPLKTPFSKSLRAPSPCNSHTRSRPRAPQTDISDAQAAPARLSARSRTPSRSPHPLYRH